MPGPMTTFQTQLTFDDYETRLLYRLSGDIVRANQDAALVDFAEKIRAACEEMADAHGFRI